MILQYQPYISPCYQYIFPYYEQFGNYIVPVGQEIWLYINDLAIPGIDPNRYMISNRLRIFDTKRNAFASISYNSESYPSVSLYIPSTHTNNSYFLHYVYMRVFCYFPGCDNMQVNHIDGNKANFNPCNLEWMTIGDNLRHARKYLFQKRNLTEDEIVGIIDDYNAGYSITQLMNKYNISRGYVGNIVRNRCSSVIAEIRQRHPVTRDEYTVKVDDKFVQMHKLSRDALREAAARYSNGEDYYTLAQEYNVDRSTLTKQIKRYAKDHPEIILRPLKKFTPELANIACTFIQNNKNKFSSVTELYDACLEYIGLENNYSNRKALKNMYHGKTYTYISSQYNLR